MGDNKQNQESGEGVECACLVRPQITVGWTVAERQEKQKRKQILYIK